MMLNRAVLTLDRAALWSRTQIRQHQQQTLERRINRLLACSGSTFYSGPSSSGNPFETVWRLRRFGKTVAVATFSDWQAAKLSSTEYWHLRMDVLDQFEQALRNFQRSEVCHE